MGTHGYRMCYNDLEYNTSQQGEMMTRLPDYRGLWPNSQQDKTGERTIFIHKRLFLQAFLDPRRQNDMSPLWPIRQLSLL
jgi:hypothetical protein